MSTNNAPSTAADGLSRREFTLEAALALLAGCVITVTEACGSDSPTSASPPADVNGVIAGNHGHTAVVTGAQITTGSAISLDIQGTAVHHHTVSVSQADLQTLKNRQPVTHESSSDASATFGTHSHTVTFTPA